MKPSFERNRIRAIATFLRDAGGMYATLRAKHGRNPEIVSAALFGDLEEVARLFMDLAQKHADAYARGALGLFGGGVVQNIRYRVHVTNDNSPPTFIEFGCLGHAPSLREVMESLTSTGQDYERER